MGETAAPDQADNVGRSYGETQAVPRSPLQPLIREGDVIAMALPHPDPADPSYDPDVLPTIVIALGAFAIGIFVRVVAMALHLEPTYATLLPFYAGAATFAGAAAVEAWRPRWMGDRRKTTTWIGLRLIIVGFAIVATAGIVTRSLPSGCPLTYSGDASEDGGVLLHSKLVGDTIVCTYEHRGGGL